MKKLTHLFVLLTVLLSACASAFAAAPIIPVTSFDPSMDLPRTHRQGSLASFIDSVQNGNSDQIVGVYHYDNLNAPVVQQPSGNAGFVSSEADIVTEFGMTRQYGVIALLAHNHLLGANFAQIDLNQRITLVYGDGHTHAYKVVDIRSYQALSPTSPYSNFINLADPDQTVLSANDLFFDIYATPDRLVLQTCIEKDGEMSWGRLFVVAEPIETVVVND